MKQVLTVNSTTLGIPDSRKKQTVTDLYAMKNAQYTTSPQPDILASFTSNICFSVLTVLCKTNRI